MRLKHNYLKLLALMLCYSNTGIAGGPLVVEGSNGDTPVKYQLSNITLHAESGPLNSSTTNAEANALIQDAFNLWNNVNTSTVTMILNSSTITNDINNSNANNLIDDVNDGINPIIYDNNGSIIDDLFGGADELGNLPSDSTIGVAASAFIPGREYFLEGYAIINGKISLNETDFKLLIAHELGHFLGLDHSQVNINNQEDLSGTTTLCTSETIKTKYPVMYPFVCRDEETLHTDDISSISLLYPTSTINNNFGIIEGRFVDENGDAILGANIWAENTTTGNTVSITSDYLKQNSGYYKLYLTPGNYTLHANSINTLFNDGSGIGPYSTSLTDKSFTSPHPITEVSLTAADNTSDAVITLSSNQTITINLSITGNDVVLPDISTDKKSSGATSFFSLVFVFIYLAIARRRCL